MDPCRDFHPFDMGDQESGIDLAYDMSVILNGTLDEHIFGSQAEINQDDAASLTTPPSSLNGTFYQLKSKPVSESSPPSQTCKVIPRSRTLFKQELMREQSLLEEKRAQTAIAPRQNIQPAAAIPFHPTIPNVDVPPQILQVRTRLENPTYYHLKHSQQRQVRQYLNHSVSGSVPQSPVSSPARNGLLALTPHLQNRLQANKNGPFAVSAPPTLLNTSGTSSPGLTQSSLATSLNSIESEQEVEADLVEDILSLEADRPTTSGSKFYATTTHKALSDPSFPGLNFGSAVIDPQENSNTSYLDGTGSAPVSPAEDHVRQAQVKDRQKKDNHNMIERRRRFNINDRIKELGTLLPRNQSDPYFEQVGEFRPNKGTILKASVDYIKLLKMDAEKIKPLEAELKKQAQRVKELEKMLLVNGIQISDSELLWKPSSTLLTDFIKTEVKVKKEPELSTHCHGGHVGDVLVLDDLMEDDNTVVTGDPMLTTTLDSQDEIPTQQLNEGMDFF